MDRRKSLLVNIGEAETDAVLREVATKLDVRVFAKTRLADVVEIRRSGLSNDEYRYALQAHLDFVIALASDGRPHFAVEFDGPYHDTDAGAQRRDTMKGSICARLGLPLLRIDADYLRTVRGFRLLAWLVELWFLDEAFSEEQMHGRIPRDEPFDPQSVMELKDGRITFPYSLAGDAQQEIARAYGQGLCNAPHPDHYFRTRDNLVRRTPSCRFPATAGLLATFGSGAFDSHPSRQVKSQTSLLSSKWLQSLRNWSVVSRWPRHATNGTPC